MAVIEQVIISVTINMFISVIRKVTRHNKFGTGGLSLEILYVRDKSDRRITLDCGADRFSHVRIKNSET